MSLAPYMEWAKQHPRSRFNLAGSNLLACELSDLPGAREALELHGDNDNGYRPLIEAIATTYGVAPDMVVHGPGHLGRQLPRVRRAREGGRRRAGGAAGLRPADGAAAAARRARHPVRPPVRGRLSARSRTRVRAAITDRTRLIVVTNAHNPTGVVAAETRPRRDRPDRRAARRARAGRRGVPRHGGRRRRPAGGRPRRRSSSPRAA